MVSQFPMNDGGTNPVNFSTLVILVEGNGVMAAPASVETMQQPTLAGCAD